MEFELILITLFSIGVIYAFLKRRKQAQLAYIKYYKFPSRVAKKVKEKYPHLSDKDVNLVLKALRDYFSICNIAKKKMIAMPSQVVDVAWHEFILMTHDYERFCKRAFGHFLHHSPTETMQSEEVAHESLKRAWRISCSIDNIDPSKPDSLPLLFSVDIELNIKDGFKYSLNSTDNSNDSGYNANNIGCSSSCASDSGSSSNCSGGSSCGGGGD